MKAPLALVLGLSFVFVACSDDETESPPAAMVGAAGVSITEVAIYQGLKRDLMLSGAPAEGGVPLIAGRDGVVRVFYTTDEGYAGGEVVGRLEIDGADPIEVSGTLRPASTDGDVSSTLNFTVPGSLVGETFGYRVSILEESTAADNAAARWPAEGAQDVAIEGAKNTLRVVFAPVRYDFDGSGRLPDLSEATLESYRARLQQLFPVSGVEVSVREPMAWDQEISPNGDGWNEIIARLIDLRAEDGAPDDAYYYGLFNPTETLAQFCSQGCLLGATLLNDGPPEEGEVALRLALGLGFPDYAADTIPHELGHAHGRKHADCGSGIDPLSIDHDYPYEEGLIGEWGLDPATLQLYPPTVTTDIMSYCPVQWVSDYTYRGLFERGAQVNLPRWLEASARKRVAVVSIDGKRASWSGTRSVSSDLRGRRAPATLVKSHATRESVDAVFYPFDHLPGGIALLPVGDANVDAIELDLDGVRHTVVVP